MKNLNMGRPGSMFILGAIILGGLTAYALYDYLQNVSKVHLPTVKLITVIRAKTDIPARHEITADQLEIIRIPPEMQNTGTATDANQVLGKVCITLIKAQEQVRLKDLAEKGKAPGLAYNIPQGMRAITIGISDTKGVSGAIYPGDHVDILCSLRDNSRGQQVVQVPLQNLKVIAIDRAKTEATEMGATTSLTLCVKPEEAQMLTVAEESGSMRVILRSTQDENLTDDKGVSIDQFLKRAPRTAEETKGDKTVDVAPAPAPATPATPKKIKIFDGPNMKEFDVNY